MSHENVIGEAEETPTAILDTLPGESLRGLLAALFVCLLNYDNSLECGVHVDGMATSAAYTHTSGIYFLNRTCL